MEFPKRYEDMGISKRDYWRATAKHEGLPFLENISELTPETLSALPETYVVRLRSIPFRATEQTIDVAIDDPWDYDLRDQLKFCDPRPITYHLTLPETIDEALDRYYRKRS